MAYGERIGKQGAFQKGLFIDVVATDATGQLLVDIAFFFLSRLYPCQRTGKIATIEIRRAESDETIDPPAAPPLRNRPGECVVAEAKQRRA